ncbi:AAA family ATPase, partial [Acinetobacter radioresistens]
MQLEKFLITKLNGDQNIEICFDENKKVVIAENGSGKTTIMNILYYALKNDVNGLKKYDYEKCILKFSGKNEIIFEKNKLEKINNSQNLNKIFKESRDIELINTN